jgi:hypothetical protein
MKFTYRSGQRPLDGYTIKRGVGQGGFGEVYFAVSDGGKEVALKLLRGHSDIELRGVANCLNMKHPNLVHVYDLKEDEHADKWLVMEYVLGESLASVLNRHPHGVPLNLAKEWFAALARAVGYLHDRGVVHRDLKPANIFIEAGTLKVGDYGLCKSISVSQKQTRTVGTVHYMAPEVSTGSYSQRIDLYACGVILHELLTGKVPFDGESDGEILMKHLTATPDLSLVPEAFKSVVSKALDKNPLRRYGSMAEMAKAVEVVMESLTPATGVAVATVASSMPKVVPVAKAYDPAPTLPARPLGSEGPAPPPLPAAVALADPPARAVGNGGPSPASPQPDATKLPLARPVTWKDRVVGQFGAVVFAPVVAAVGMAPYALIAGTVEWLALGKMFLVTTGAAWAMLIGSGTARYGSDDSWGRRLRLGGIGMAVGALAFWLDGWTGPATAHDDVFPTAVRYLLYFGGVMAAGRWWRATARDRKERFSLFPVVAAGFWSAVLLFLWPWASGGASNGVVPLVLAAIAVQAVSPWSPPVATNQPKKLRLRGV